MQLYFIDDTPRVIISSLRYARVRKDYVEFEHNGDTFYLAAAISFQECIEHNRMRLEQAKNGWLEDNFASAILPALRSMIDPARGDGFTLNMLDSDDLIDMLLNVEEGK